MTSCFRVEYNSGVWNLFIWSVQAHKKFVRSNKLIPVNRSKGELSSCKVDSVLYMLYIYIYMLYDTKFNENWRLHTRLGHILLIDVNSVTCKKNLSEIQLSSAKEKFKQLQLNKT